MLSSHAFNDWCQQLQVNSVACAVIEQVRNAAPSRQVQGRRKNVCGSYPSRKMGLTIQFESHRNELARIHELEHDQTVLEYYDQPPPIELVYSSKTGRRTRHQYTPDFFVLRTDGVEWEECKTETELIKLAQENSNRYCQDVQGKWHCPPGEAYAQVFGFRFRVWCSCEINWVLQDNWVWLEDYMEVEVPLVAPAALQALQRHLQQTPGICVSELLAAEPTVSPDDLYRLVATEQVYVDLAAARLSEPEQVRVFLDQDMAQAFHRIQGEFEMVQTNKQSMLNFSIGTVLHWDEVEWEVINIGANTVGLLRSEGEVIELAKPTLENLVSRQRIVASHNSENTEKQKIINDKIKAILQEATSAEIAEANCRYDLIQACSNTSRHPSSTVRRWQNQYQKAEKIYGNGYVGLLPRYHTKGNRTMRIDDIAYQFMIEFIEQHYENPKQRRKQRVYEAFVSACEAHEPKLIPPSRITFSQAIDKRAGQAQTLKRAGRRAAIAKEAFYWQLERTTPQHGSRPFEIVHLDHTQLDIELMSPLSTLAVQPLASNHRTLSQNLGRPWATFMVDAYSRRLLAAYLTYEEPSYRSCMMALRICVQRFERLPQILVVDNGVEFHSHYFEELLAYYACTKKHRPPAMARFGSVVERLFGTANTQFVHELQGNTQITRQVRQVTQSVNPKRLAIWTLSDLYPALCEWAYEIYDQREHPALGQSPRDIFTQGLALGGTRDHRRVENNEVFQILTLPAPDQRRRKVQPGRGVKIHNIYYWSNAFRDPKVEGSQVEVKYDPFDASIAYAFVHYQWVKCISTYCADLQGRSERELRLVSEELRQRQRVAGCRHSLSDKELVEFLNSQHAKEGQFLQRRLQAVEQLAVLQQLDPAIDDTDAESQQMEFGENAQSSCNDNSPQTAQTVPAIADFAAPPEFYGEF